MPTKRALIVDDSTTAQYRLKKMLRIYDLQIDAVDSGEAALLHLASNVPDVIFMDHLMPGMDGFRALQIIKSHPETAMIPVVMYTSKSGDLYTGQARALGALDVISKDTINSSDLSKVMNGIHIYQRNTEQLDSDNIEVDDSPLDDEIRPQLDLSDLPAGDKVVRADGTGTDNSRRIELRISQMEHAIDDSRRVITARLVREIQKLRSSISREMTEHFAKKTPSDKSVDEANSFQQLTPPPAPAGTSSMILVVIVILLVVSGGLMLHSFNKINERLSALSEQQAEERSHLNTVTNNLLAMQETLTQQTESQIQQGVKGVKANTLSDLVWAFNQSSILPFNPSIIDSKVTQRLNEFIYRISQQGFKGAVWINLNAGDFCVETTSSGQAQLPANNVRMSDCVLLSELYRIESLMDRAVEDINASAMKITSVSKGDISVIVSRLDDQLTAYPARQSQTLAKDWNRVAQMNNRISVELSDLDSLE